MGELFKQYIDISNIIVAFLITTMLFYIIFIVKTRKFEGKIGQIKLYGIFSGMEDAESIMFAFVIMQFVTVICGTISKINDIRVYIIILVVTSLAYALYDFKKFILEIVSLILELTALYLNMNLYKYRLEVENLPYIRSIQYVLITFIILYAIYLLLVHIEGIVKKNKNVRRNRAGEKR